MAVKSVFEVDVRDQAFQRFQAVFEKYQKNLKLAPKEWAEVTKKIGESRKEFDKLVNQQIAQQARTKLIAEAAREADRLTSSEARSWRDMARSTGTVVGNVGRITTSLLKWSAVTGAISLIAGAAGGFGLDRLGAGVSAGRRSSLGLGTSYGSREAFGVSFGRLVEPGSFLDSVAEAKLDVSKRTGLIGAGLNDRQIAGDTGSVGVALLKRLKAIADNTDPKLYGQVIAARQLGGFASPQDLQRLHNTSPEEFAQLIRKYSVNQGRLGLDEATQRKWQDFTTQMTDAGKVIETVFVKGLTPLAPALAKLSESVAKTIETFLGNPRLKEWIDGIGSGLERLSTYVLSDDFQTGAKQFAENIVLIGHKIAEAAKWFAGNTRFGPEGNPEWDARQKRIEQMRRDRAEGKASAFSQFKDIFSSSGTEVTPGLLDLVQKLERSGDSAVSPKGAIGRYQIMPGTARQYGFDPDKLSNPDYNRQAASAVLSDLMKRYRGNVDEVLAAYNGGPGRGDKFRDSGHDMRVLPAETQGYLNRAHAMSGVKVEINNNTGGAVNVNASQIAQ